MSSGSERRAVQGPLIRYAVEAGWIYLPPEEALRLRRGEESPLLWEVFIGQAQRLNPGVVDHLAAEELGKKLSRIPPNIKGNLAAWEHLKGMGRVFVPAERCERNVRLVDFDDWTRNIYHVSDEFRFFNGVHRIRADVVFLINGLPVILVETKSAKKIEGITEALDQVRRYHREGPELLALLQLFGLTHLIQFYYGATWNLSHKNVFNWKEETGAASFEELVKSFVRSERVLRVLRDYILFTRRDGELSKVVLRPHQMRAAERVLSRAYDRSKRRGLIWHTQGSGKTYTMISIAKRLIEDPVFENPTVLMIVDRNELQQQLFANLGATLGLGQIEVARNKNHLRELLRSDTRGLIVSMIHKFDDVPPNLNSRHNIFVLVDEAHRSTGGDLGNYLMGALPNATFIGFTGTPIDKTAHGKGTFKVFGRDDPPHGYLDKYSIAESIADGTTVPLYYSLAPNELRVDRETLEKEFWSLVEAEGVSDVEDLNRVLDKAVTLRNMLKNPERIRRVAAYVAQHFRDTVEPMGFKAFLVAVDREACALYKEALDKYLDPDYSRVVISPGHNDPELLKRYHLSEDEEKEIRENFRKTHALPKILIVTEKLLTGFDAPVLYCMYLDKPMRDHVLLQAIARVNRPYEDEEGHKKPGGFILDFVGILENLEKALAFDSRDVDRVIEHLDVVKNRFKELMAAAREKYLPLCVKGKADKAAEAALEHFRDDERRQEFYSFFRELEDTYEIISPNPWLRPYVDDYHRVADLYSLLVAAYESRDPLRRELARKTAKLVQEHTRPGLIEQVVDVFEVTPETLARIAGSGQPEAVKVVNLVRVIAQLVERERHSAPYLIPIGERAERIVEAFKHGHESAKEALRHLSELIEEINAAERERAEKEISPGAFTVLYLLKKRGLPPPQTGAAVQEVEKLFSEYPAWATSEKQSRYVRRELYKILGKLDVEQLPEVVKEIMRILGRYNNGG